MRSRVFLVGAMAVLVSLVSATAALAAETAPPSLSHVKTATQAAAAGIPLSQRQGSAADATGAQPAAALSRLGVTITTCTVNGTVLDYDGDPVSDAVVSIFYEYDGTLYWGGSQATGADGAFLFTDVPTPSIGELDVSLPDGNATWTTALSFTDPGPHEYTLRPGQIGVQLTDVTGDGILDWINPYLVELYGTGGGASTWLDEASDNALATEPDVNYGVMYPILDRWKFDRGIEAFVDPAISVASGETNGSLEFDEADARDATLASPYWASGKGGKTVKATLANFPAGQSIFVSGYSYSPREDAKSWGNSPPPGRR